MSSHPGSSAVYADNSFCTGRGLYRKKGETRHEHEERKSQDIRRGGAWTQGRDGHGKECSLYGIIKDCKEMKWAWFQSMGVSTR